MSSAEFKEEIIKQSTNKVILILLELSHTDANWGSTVKYVNNVVPITSNGSIYQPRGFSFVPASTTKEGSPEARLEIEDVDQVLTSKFRSVTDRPKVKISVIMSDTPDIIEMGPSEFEITKTSLSGATISCMLKKETILENNLSGHYIDTDNFPGLGLLE